MKGDTVGDTVAEKVSRQFLAFSFQDSGLFKGYLCSKFQRCIESLNPVGPWFIPDLWRVGRVTSTGRWDYPFCTSSRVIQNDRFVACLVGFLSHSLEQGQHSTLTWHEPWNCWVVHAGILMAYEIIPLYVGNKICDIQQHIQGFGHYSSEKICSSNWMDSTFPSVGVTLPNKTSSTSPPR